MVRVTLLTWLLVVVKVCQSSPGIYKGPDGGYVNVVVAIHRSVPENSNLISKIKELFTLASPILHKATFGGAYFKSVIIAVPNTWRHSASYQNATEDLFGTAHFRVDGPNVQFGDEPYTQQPNIDCGKPGEYVHWTPTYLLTNFVSKWPAKRYERKEKRLIQEWAHLRYGVFDEFGYPGDMKNPSVSLGRNGILPTVCSASIEGTLDLDCPASIIEGKPTSQDIVNCSFIPSSEPLERPGASLMFTASVPGVDHFCDDSEERKHNSISPSKHNDMCNGESTWSVIKRHEDFGNAQSRRLMAQSSRQIGQDLETRFQVVRTPGSSDGRIAFVLDVSGSMKGRPIELLNAAASRVIQDNIPDGSRVAIVAFSTRARVLANMTTVNDESRRRLVKSLPTSDDQGYTAIGQGLIKGLDAIKDVTGGAAGTRIILVTDGEENVGPQIDRVIPTLTLSGTQVMAIAFGVKATQKLERLALATNGRVFLFPDLTGKKPATALDSAFLESTTLLVSEEQQAIRIVEERLTLTKDWIERPLLVEETLGRNLAISVTATDIRPVDLTLIDPNGRSIGPGNSNFNKDESTMQRIRLEVPMAIKGTWRLSLRTSSDPTTVELQVLSHPRHYGSDPKAPRPLRIRAWVDDIQPIYPRAVRILAQVVTDGVQPVTGSTVTATVTGNKSVDVELRDNGAGADVNADDGIYSGFFTQYTGNGRYAVFVRMINYPNESNYRGDLRFRRSVARPAPVERVADAGSFRLDGWTREDLVPPSTVIDLLAVQQRGHSDRIWLTWTAPGDDMDHGRAFKIDIRTAHHPDHLRHNFTSCSPVAGWFLHNLTIAQGGENQRLELQIPASASNTTLYIALRASDKAGNTARVSNVAGVALHASTSSSLKQEEEENKLLVPLVAGGLGLLVLIALAGLVLMICTRRKNHKTKTLYFGVPNGYKE